MSVETGEIFEVYMTPFVFFFVFFGGLVKEAVRKTGKEAKNGLLAYSRETEDCLELVRSSKGTLLSLKLLKADYFSAFKSKKN